MKTGPGDARARAERDVHAHGHERGPSTAVTVALADTLPAGTTFVSLASPGGWSCVDAGGRRRRDRLVHARRPSRPLTPASSRSPWRSSPSVADGHARLEHGDGDVGDAGPDRRATTRSTRRARRPPSADLSIVKTGPRRRRCRAGRTSSSRRSSRTTVRPTRRLVSVADPTPAGLVFVSNAGAASPPSRAASGRSPPGATRTITIDVPDPVRLPGPAPIVNTATVSSSTPDPTPGNNTSTATVLVPTGVADIAVTKTVEQRGARRRHERDVHDHGLGPRAERRDGRRVTDVLPSGLTFVSATPSQGAYTPAHGRLERRQRRATARPRRSQIVATVTQAGTIVNTATKTAGNETDPNPSNNSGSAVVNGPAAVADIQVQKTVDVPAPVVGANVTFTVTCSTRALRTPRTSP